VGRSAFLERDFVLSLAVEPSGLIANQSELDAELVASEAPASDGDLSLVPDVTMCSMVWAQTFNLAFSCVDLSEVHMMLNLKDAFSKERSDPLVATAVVPLGALYAAALSRLQTVTWL
jgi:hypothetical protein